MGEGKGWSARRGTVVSVVVMAAILALILAGCSGSASSRATPSMVTSVHVLRTSAFSSYHIPRLDRTVSDAAKAQRLYNVTQALPPFPHGVMSCPNDIGVAYYLTFYQDREVVSWAAVNPYGCRQVTLPNGDIRATMDDFWQVFADALGVPESDLFPHNMSFDSSAPTATPGQP